MLQFFNDTEVKSVIAGVATWQFQILSLRAKRGNLIWKKCICLHEIATSLRSSQWHHYDASFCSQWHEGEIAALPSVARNDTFISSLINKSLAELLSKTSCHHFFLVLLSVWNWRLVQF